MIGYRPLPLIKYCLKYVTPLICTVSWSPFSHFKAEVPLSLLPNCLQIKQSFYAQWLKLQIGGIYECICREKQLAASIG